MLLVGEEIYGGVWFASNGSDDLRCCALGRFGFVGAFLFVCLFVITWTFEHISQVGFLAHVYIYR